jgi:hypothetical protein
VVSIQRRKQWPRARTITAAAQLRDDDDDDGGGSGGLLVGELAAALLWQIGRWLDAQLCPGRNERAGHRTDGHTKDCRPQRQPCSGVRSSHSRPRAGRLDYTSLGLFSKRDPFIALLAADNYHHRPN